MEDFARIRGLTRRFDSVVAVDHVDLDVAQGSLLALLGPSGCGKTTLLRLIGGLDVPDEGTIEVDGRVLNGPGRFVPPERRQVVMVFQDLALFPHMDAGRNVAFGLPRGSDRRRRVGELMELVGLRGLERRMPHELSGGQQQRVALARALAAEPRLILLDEPFSNLDPGIRAKVRVEVRQLLHEIGITAIFVTHDQDEALSLADRIAVMIEGRILQAGTPAEVYLRPRDRAVAEFVGHANVLAGTARDSSVSCELGCFGVPGEFDGPADVVIRAENVRLGLDSGIAAEVVSLNYYGHDQVVTVALPSGFRVRAHRPANEHFIVGQAVGVRVEGDVLAFPTG